MAKMIAKIFSTALLKKVDGEGWDARVALEQQINNFFSVLEKTKGYDIHFVKQSSATVIEDGISDVRLDITIVYSLL